MKAKRKTPVRIPKGLSAEGERNWLRALEDSALPRATAIAEARAKVVEAAMANWSYNAYDENGDIKPHKAGDPHPADLQVAEDDACAALAALEKKP